MLADRRTAMSLSLAVAGVMLVGKLVAYWLTGSYAMLSDAAESVVHLFATAFAAFAMWLAARPADENHPYGHGRMVYFSAGFEGALIFVTALFVAGTAIRALLTGITLTNLGPGIAIAGGLALVNLALGGYLLWLGKRQNALVLVAHARHVLTDVWTTAAALVGLGLVMLTGHEILDPLAALLIGVVIAASGFLLLRRSLAGLMDEAPRTVTETLLAALREEVRAGHISGFHQLRFRQVEDELWIEVHLFVPGAQTVAQSHATATEIEQRIFALFPEQQVWVTSHVEPDEAHADLHGAGHEARDPLAEPRVERRRRRR